MKANLYTVVVGHGKQRDSVLWQYFDDTLRTHTRTHAVSSVDQTAGGTRLERTSYMNRRTAGKIRLGSGKSRWMTGSSPACRS